MRKLLAWVLAFCCIAQVAAAAVPPIPPPAAPFTFTPLQLEVQRILRAAEAAKPTQVMATPPTFIPSAYGICGGTVVSGGTGAVTGEVDVVPGGTLATNGTAATLLVTASSGVVTGVRVLSGGFYTTPPTGTVTMTNAAGSTYTVTFTTGCSPLWIGFQGGNGSQARPHINTKGSGYVAYNTLTAVGGTLAAVNGRSAQFAIDNAADGGCDSAYVTDPGNYAVLPATPVATATNGSGSGCLIDLITSQSRRMSQEFTNSGPPVMFNDPNCEDISGQLLWDTNGHNGGISSGISRTTGSTATLGGGINGVGKRCLVNGRYWGVCLNVGSLTPSVASGYGFAVYVTDLTTGVRQRTQASDYMPANTSWGCSYLDFGTYAPRLIETYLGRQTQLRGFDVETVASVSRYRPPNEIKSALVGDSFAEDYYSADYVRIGYAYQLGELLGTANMTVNGCSGTGVLNPATCNTFNFRLQAGNLNVSAIGQMDIVFLQCPSGNDRASYNAAYTDAAVATATTQELQLARTAQPNAILVCMPPQNTPNLQSTASRYTSTYAAFQAFQASDTGPLGPLADIYLDNSPAGGHPWELGNGCLGALAYDGWNDRLLYSDCTHPTEPGHIDLARRIMADLLIALRPLSGLGSLN